MVLGGYFVPLGEHVLATARTVLDQRLSARPTATVAAGASVERGVDLRHRRGRRRAEPTDLEESRRAAVGSVLGSAV